MLKSKRRGKRGRYYGKYGSGYTARSIAKLCGCEVTKIKRHLYALKAAGCDLKDDDLIGSLIQLIRNKRDLKEINDIQKGKKK